MTLLAAAILATAADTLAYLTLVLPGRVAEANPVVAGLAPSAAVGARLLTLVALASLYVSRRAPRATRAATWVCVLTGLVGAASSAVAA